MRIIRIWSARASKTLEKEFRTQVPEAPGQALNIPVPGELRCTWLWLFEKPLLCVIDFNAFYSKLASNNAIYQICIHILSRTDCLAWLLFDRGSIILHGRLCVVANKIGRLKKSINKFEKKSRELFSRIYLYICVSTVWECEYFFKVVCEMTILWG